MKYKLLSTDIDRTFSKQNQIFLENLKYLNYLKENGIILVANTGRGLISGEFITKLDLFDYFIGNDGSFIYDLNKNELIYNIKIKKDIANGILQKANKHKIPWVVDTMDKIFYADMDETKTKEFLSTSKYKYEYKTLINEDVNRILLLLEKKDIKTFIKEFPTFPNLYNDKLNCSYNNRNWDITDINASKGNALKWLINKLNIDTKDILTIGNSANDLSMIQVSVMSVAMKDSDDILLKHSQFITDSEENFGWIKGLKHYE